MRYVTVRLTVAEAEAAFSEIETATFAAEENLGPKHPQHYAAKRAMRKLALALGTETLGPFEVVEEEVR